MELGERNQSLTIKVVNVEHIGLYCCKVSNIKGEVQSEGSVTLAGESSLDVTGTWHMLLYCALYCDAKRLLNLMLYTILHFTKLCIVYCISNCYRFFFTNNYVVCFKTFLLHL